MSVEVVLHPKAASRDDLRRFLKEQGYLPCQNLWDCPKGTLNFHWYEYTDYLSYDGVEATIYKPSSDKHQLGPCDWALHTRTRLSASPADKDQQDKTIRLARAKFGGHFYNDWHGKNRYIRREPDHRDAASRGIYLTYTSATHNIGAVQYSVRMTEELHKEETADRKIRDQAQEKLKQQSRKVELGNVIAIKEGSKSLEDVIADWYSFQNIDSIHKAFSEWLGIDFWKIIRTKKKFGRRIDILEKRLTSIIEFRHGIIHRLEIDRSLTKKMILETLDTTSLVIDEFVDFLESEKGKRIRDD